MARILVIDDDEAMCSVLSHIFGRNGLGAASAISRIEAGDTSCIGGTDRDTMLRQ